MQRKYELSVQNGCVLCGSRVVVPPPGRAPILKLMKALARSVVWWPGLDEELENKVKSCTTCKKGRIQRGGPGVWIPPPPLGPSILTMKPNANF